jgi:sulfur relay (sulfurtransferase) complex TusBCD TusD component (DsrE family)
MDDGVRYALDARLQALLSVGVELTLCATDAAARALPCDELEALGVVIGSQHDHARLVRDSDRFLSFT